MHGSRARHGGVNDFRSAGLLPRVVVVEDDVLLAESLTLACAAQGWSVTSMQAPADATGPSAFVEAILATRPTAVLLDLELSSGHDGLALVARLSRMGGVVVAMTGRKDQAQWGHALDLGAHAVISKSAGLARMLETLHGVIAGKPLTSESERLELIQYWRRYKVRVDGNQARLDRLSPREAQVLAQLASGRRVVDIAEDFRVSRATVRTQVQSILTKLRVHSQIAAVALARDVGWSPPASEGSTSPSRSVRAGS